MRVLLLFLLLASFMLLVSSFDFFDFFNDMGDEQPGPGSRRAGREPNERDDSVTTAKRDPRHDCVGYVCAGSDKCVAAPLDCPCPYGTFKYYTDEWYVCIQYEQIRNGDFPIKVV